jgi:voltage-dependent calcium channel L type alpha-1D
LAADFNRHSRYTHRFHLYSQVPRSNFDSLPWAIATVFQIVTGDNWSGVLYDAMRGNGMFASLYFIVLVRHLQLALPRVSRLLTNQKQVILGDFILMNLFLALLLDNFASRSVSSAAESNANTQSKQLTKRRSKVSPIEASKQRILRRMVVARTGSRDLQWQTPREGRRNSARPDLSSLNSQRSAPGARLSRTPSNFILAVNSFQQGTVQSMRTNSRLLSHTALDPPASRAQESFYIPEDGQANSKPSTLQGRSLYLFGPSSHVRQWAVKTATHPVFDSVMFVLIIASSVVLAVENPLHDPESSLSKSLLMLDKVFAVAFIFEMAVKIVSLGLVLHNGAYLRSWWNVIDGLVAVSSALLLFGHLSSTSSLLKSFLWLRDLRALRPLRMISRRPGLKLVVSALVESIPAVMNVVFLSMVLFLLFSIAAVHFLKGAFRACSGDVFDALSAEQQAFLVTPFPWDTMSTVQQAWFVNTTCERFPTDTLTSEYICECWGAAWTPTLAKNFDNVGSAMLTFFILSTSENWSEIMKAACDATGPGMQPAVNHNELWIVFFIVFMVVGSFFVMNVFVGVVIDNFNTMKAKLGGDFLLTPEQKKWMEAQKSARRIGPIRVLKPPPQRIRRVFFTIVRTHHFEVFVMSCILVNTLLMAAHHFGESHTQHYATLIVNETSTAIFAVEAAMKLVAYGRAYFQDQWNQFDFFVVVATLLGTIVQAFGTSAVWTLTLLVSLLRVARIFRLVEFSSSIRAILSTLYISLPGLTNITSILFLILFVYATMGVHLFAKVGLTSNIDTHANFLSFGRGFLFLLRAATGESWDYCMYDLASSTWGCVDDPPFDPNMCGFSDAEDCIPLNGCGNPVAYLFFCSFTLIVAYVMLNLTVAVVLESFATSQEEQEEALLVPELLEEFQYKWAEFDPMATGFIRVEKMLPLVHSILPPLGWFGVPLTMPQFFRYLGSLQLPLYGGEQVKFRDVVLAMTKEMMRAVSCQRSDRLLLW